jgi:plasmid stability protein
MGDLSIKGVPEEQIVALRERAKRNHRSLQGELRAMLDAVTTAPSQKAMSLEELSAHAQSLGLTRRREAVRMIREDRDR